MRYVDMHSDMPTLFLQGEPFQKNDCDIDIDKLQRGDCLAQFFAIYIPTHDGDGDLPLDRTPDAFFWDMRAAYLRELDMNHDAIAPAFCIADIEANRASGRISAFLSLEDATFLNGDVKKLDVIYDAGVRMASFTWNYANTLASPCSTDKTVMNAGLTPFGIETLHRMNERGMIMDVSHLSDGGFWDVVRLANKPFVASHSSSRTILNHPRNLTDNMLRALADKGGVAGVNFVGLFINGAMTYVSNADLLRHIEHMVQVAGEDAVGFGADFSTFPHPYEMKDYSGMPSLEELLHTRFTAAQVDKICGENVLRVIRDVLG